MHRRYLVFLALIGLVLSGSVLRVGATVPTSTITISYAGTGAQTSFPIPYAFDLTTDIHLSLCPGAVPASCVEQFSGFTVAKAIGAIGGTLTIAAPPAVGVTVVVDRRTPIKQEIAFTPGAAFDASKANRGLDRPVLMIQEGIAGIVGPPGPPGPPGPGGGSTGYTDVTGAGAICNGTDQHVPIEALIGTGVTHLFLPANCKWIPTGNVIPANLDIVGGDWQTTILASSNTVTTTLSLGNNTIVRNVAIAHKNCTDAPGTPSICPTRWYMNSSGAARQFANWPNQPLAAIVGGTDQGSNDRPGIYLESFGDGDPMFIQTNAAAAGLNMFGKGTGGAGGNPAINIGRFTPAGGVNIYTNDAAATGGYGLQIGSAHQTGGAFITMSQSVATFGGAGIAMNFGAGGGAHTGPFLLLQKDSANKFAIGNDGTTILSGASALDFTETGANVTETVGFVAPSSIAASFRMQLPAALSSGGKCLGTANAGVNPIVLDFVACAGGGGGGAPAGSDGQVQFNAAGIFGADANLFWVNATKRLGVGTSAPAVTLDVRGLTTISTNAATLPASAASTVLQVAGADGAATYVTIDSFGTQTNGFQGRGARGTAVAPTASQTNDQLAALVGLGRGATVYSSTARGSHGIYAGGVWTDSSQPTFQTFATTPVGSTTNTERMRIGTDGAVSITGDRTGHATGQLRILGATDPTKRLEVGYDTSTNRAFLDVYNAGVSGDLYLQGTGGTIILGNFVLVSPLGLLTVNPTSLAPSVITNEHSAVIQRNETLGNVDTRGGQNAALYVVSTGNNGGVNAQVNGMWSEASQAGTGDAAAYLAKVTHSGTGGGFGYYANVTATSATAGGFGLAFDVDNSSGVHDAYTYGSFPRFVGVDHNNGGVSRGGIAALIRSGAAPWLTGISFWPNAVLNKLIESQHYNVLAAGNTTITFGSGSGATPHPAAQQYVVDSDGNAGQSILTPNSGVGGHLMWGAPANNAYAYLRGSYNGGAPLLDVFMNSALAMRFAPALQSIFTPTVITTNAAALPAAPGGTLLRVAPADGAAGYMTVDVFGAGTPGGFLGRAARGTAAAPTPITTNDQMNALLGLGRGVGGYSGTARGSVGIYAAEDWGIGAGAQGAMVTVGVTPAGSTTLLEAARFSGNRGIGFVTTAPTIAGSRNGQGSIDIPPNSFGAFGPTTKIFVTGLGILDADTTVYTTALNPTGMNNGAGSATFNLQKNMGPAFGGIGIALNLATYDTRTDNTSSVEHDQVNLWSTMVNNSGRTLAGAINAYIISVRVNTLSSIIGEKIEMVNLTTSDVSSHGLLLKPGEEANQQLTEGVLGDAIHVLSKNVRSPGSPICGIGGVCLTAATEGWTNAFHLVGLDQVTTVAKIVNDGAWFSNVPVTGNTTVFHLQRNSVSLVQVDNTTSATDLPMVLNYNGSLRRVHVGAADSCTAGFRCLRIDN